MPGFIQITDTHIVAPGKLVCGHSDTAEALRRAVETINAKLPVLDGIDCVIVTGDLTDHGTPEEYGHFAKIMADLVLPWRAVPGNHDRRDAMRAAFSDRPWMPEAGPIHWLRDFGPFSVIALDTLLEGAHHGELCTEGFAFFDATLADLGDQPVVLATHHPWMHSGIPAMDADNLHNGAALLERLEAHPGPVRMLSGHVHRAMTGQIGRVVCQIAPATCHAVLTDHRPGLDAQMVLEQGGFTVCRWIDAPGSGLVCDVIASGAFLGPFSFQE
ncbi:phosphodiesterase [Rubrimonas cliftonensis]|uniref:Calcineurin-like phosphoesterase n=1 Tax=Rubrimonas cliftonensis TaxID=89524 RepID=A0A1H4ENX9_9RHOB|nr:phosphodiesterase [Rubrimonas cliftonensis]SEA86559.1 Calcineurin-like phosphoesterase [Rubrimonas cliftonensis]